MVNNSINNIPLPAEAKATIWRIFGSGESPLTGRSTYELIEPIIRKHVIPRTEQNRAITEIQGWFESHEDQRWLKSDMNEPVAAMILEGIKADRSETAIWAIGSIDANVAVSIIRSRWSPEEIDSFVEAVLATLKKLCIQDVVIDTDRISWLDSASAKIPKNAVKREGRLETF